MKRIALLAMSIALGSALQAQEQMGGHFIENWDLDGDGAVTLAEATERRGDIFLTFDADEDGVISAEEYTLFDEARAHDMEGIPQGGGHGGQPMKRAEQGLRREFNDNNGDGQVSHEEFVGNTPAWFAQIDRNGDGTVDSADFGPGMGMGKGHGKTSN